MMDFPRQIILLTLLLSCSLLTKGQSDALTALEKKLSDAQTDSARARTCLELHDATFKVSQQQAKQYALSALEYARSAHITVMQSLAYAALARCERKNRDYPAVYPYDSLSMLTALESGNKDMIFAAQLVYAHDYLDDNKSPQAYPWLQKAEATAAITGKPEQQAKIYHALAYYYRESDHHKLAIPYYRKAIAAFEASGNTYKAAEARVFLAESMLAIGKTDSTPNLLFDAMEIYKKNGNVAGLAYANQVLGNIFLMNGDADKGLSYYAEAQRLYKESNNKVEMALTIPDMARASLYKKEYQVALLRIREADSVFTSMQYNYGRIKVYTLWGQYYSEKGERQHAEDNFKRADSLLRSEYLPDLKTENEKYWAQHKYRYRNFSAGDSLTYEYAQRIAGSKEPESIARELNRIKEKNRSLDSNSLKILAMLYRPGGAKLLRDQLKEKSLYQLLPMDSLEALNPFSMGSRSYDSGLTASFSRQVLELEQRYKTKQIGDSLQIARQEGQLVRQNAARQQASLISIAVIAGMLGLGLWLQYKSRRQAERDRARIQLLQNEIHHRVKNNLGVVNRFVEIAERDGTENLSLNALKTRVAAMELLHKHLYQNTHSGIISLQDYLNELIDKIQESFPTSNPVHFQLDAGLMLESRMAEKLGLIINELVTNSLKYAFRDGRQGTIRIALQETAPDEYLLEVADNGGGPGATEKKKGYGARLISGLSHELNGKIRYDHSSGTRFTMSFNSMPVK